MLSVRHSLREGPAVTSPADGPEVDGSVVDVVVVSACAEVAAVAGAAVRTKSTPTATNVTTSATTVIRLRAPIRFTINRRLYSNTFPMTELWDSTPTNSVRALTSGHVPITSRALKFTVNVVRYLGRSSETPWNSIAEPHDNQLPAMPRERFLRKLCGSCDVRAK